MENKTLHRIVGVLVVIALAIIALPLLHTKTQTASAIQTASIAPPFPDSKTDNEIAQATTDAINNSIQAETVASASPEPDAMITPNLTTASNTQTLDTVNVSSSVNPISPEASNTNLAMMPATEVESTVSAKAAPISESPVINNNITVSTTNQTTQNSIASIKEDTTNPTATPDDNEANSNTEKPNSVVIIGADGHAIETIDPSQDKKIATNSIKVASNPDLKQLKKNAWVVQLGSFKNKNNAIRLANTLRAQGFKAFTYDTSSNGQTRVYIGPEYKFLAASKLAHQIQHDTKMQGVIVSYKPMEL
jgi:DedD protein